MLDEMADAAVAYGVGLVASVWCWRCSISSAWMSRSRQSSARWRCRRYPASFGAMLSGSQFGSQGAAERQHKREMGFGGILFLMAVGALFLAFNVAPTEEMFLIAVQDDPLACARAGDRPPSCCMHGFVYAANFRGAPGAPEGVHPMSSLLPLHRAGICHRAGGECLRAVDLRAVRGSHRRADDHAGRGARLPGQHRCGRRSSGACSQGRT